MKIDRIEIPAFGRLSGFDTGETPLGGLIVVLGPNEAGKSTLFSFLTTALYGFSPASRDKNPHVPWGEDGAAGSITVTLDDDSTAVVERRLRSSPSARVTRPSPDLDAQGGALDDVLELRNQPLPWVEHVPRGVFRQVFAITLADLAGLDEETWARIQDRVLGSMGASDIRPARAVAEALEREALEIWRPNRRGNQLLRDVQGEIRESRSRRNQALERDREIRELVEARENVRIRLRETREDRQRDRLALEQAQELIPIRRQLERVDALRAEGGPRSDLESLPEDPAGQLRTVTERVEELRGRLVETDAALSRKKEEIAAFTGDARTLVEHRDRISRFQVRAASVESDRIRIVELGSAIDTVTTRLEAASDQLIEADWDPHVERVVAAVSTDLLRDRIDRLAEASIVEEPVPEATTARSPLEGPLPVAALALSGAALAAWGATVGPLWALVLGVILLTIGITLHMVRRREPEPAPVPRASPADALLADIREMLKSVPLRAEYLNPPGQPAVSGLERLQRLSLEVGERSREMATARERVAGVDTEAAELSTSLCLGGVGDGEQLAAWLQRELPRAERARDLASLAVAERTKLHETSEQLRRDLADCERQRAELERTIQAAAGTATEAPLAAVTRRIEAHQEADRVLTHLQRTHPDFAEMEKRIRSSGETDEWALDDDEVVRHKARLEEIESEIESLIAHGESLDGEMAHRRRLETVDAVDSGIATLQEREQRLVAERDRKWILAQLVREADRRFREEHQPDLLRRSSTYLRQLTGGRYDRLLVDDSADGDLFHIVGPGVEAPIPLAQPISTGTLEQAYLSLRLAIVDHLDEGRERLPLFMDEVFVNWDEKRRARGLDALAEVSATRQVFAFTCHPDIASALEERGARVVRLDR